MKMGAEDAISIAVKDFCDINKIPILKVPNERKCSPIYGKLLKRMGVRAGVSDLFFPRGNKEFKGMWLELKDIGKYPTKTQYEFLHEMEIEGYYAVWSQGLDKALDIIKHFYSLDCSLC